MIVGHMHADGDALVRLVVRKARGVPQHAVEAVLDTGFNGALALPPPLVEALGLEQEIEIRVTTASGEELSVPMYPVELRLAEEPWRTVDVVAAAEALAGTALLWNKELRVSCWPGGTVRVEARAGRV